MNGEESELANQVPDPGMIASATGMRARDPWEMERRTKPPAVGGYRDSAGADIIGGFPFAEPNCKGCGKPLALENAWMTDGCPCNTALGVNSMNETRWRLLMELQQKQSRECELLRQLGCRQRDEIQNLNDMADAVECLRDIGNLVGCGHVDGPDGRRQLVNCVEQSLARSETDGEAT